MPATAAGTSGTPAVRAMRAVPVCGFASNVLRGPFFARVPSGNMPTISPCASRSSAVRSASASASPRRTGNVPIARIAQPSHGVKSSAFAM